VQAQSGSRRPARHAASRAPIRPNVFGGRHLGQPPLDVQLALYDSLGAPVSIGYLPGATMGTVLQAPVPITYFWGQDHLSPAAPLRQGRALHHARRPPPTHVPDGRTIRIRAHHHHEPGALTRPPSAINSRGNTSGVGTYVLVAKGRGGHELYSRGPGKIASGDLLA
jgi:hypothetical protein